MLFAAYISALILTDMQILNTLRLRDTSEEARFGLPQLDSLLQCMVEIRSSTSKQPSTPPILELQSLYPGDGKTHLLYYLTALAVLPITLGGKQSAVVIIDTDGRFSIPRLARQIKRQVSLDLQDSSKTDNEEVLLMSLKHVHIFSPQSLSSTTATVNSLSGYLFNADKHHSFDRTISFIALDSASAFYWQHRTDADDAALNSGKSQPSGYLLLAAALKNAVRSFNTAVIFTSWHLGAVKDMTANMGRDAQSSFRSSIPSPWPQLPTLRLVVRRAPVRKLPVEISVQDALRESETRQEVVQKGKVECFVNEFGMEESVMQKLRAVGAGFDLYVTGDGVSLDAGERGAG